MRRSELAKRIDHTLLGPTASREGVLKLCEEAVRLETASVCVSPCHARIASDAIAGTPVKLCIVIGFPHGMTTAATKAAEAREAVGSGADELDMVINVGALKDGDYEAVRADIRGVCDVARDAGRPVAVKVILETALLTNEEKETAARLAKEVGADFVKTSTGYGPGGATVEDVALLHETVGATMGVKASGGIRDYASAVAMIEAGASRIGASRTVDILEGAEP